MQRTTVERVPDAIWGGEAIVLRDNVSQSWARLRSDQGGNLVGFGAILGSREVETMLQPADEVPSRGPDQYGSPVLFPFPSRLRDGKARFGGRTIQIDHPVGAPYAIHGLVRRYAWRVDQLAAESDVASAAISIDADSETTRQFPFPYHHALTFRLGGTTLRIDVEATNTGDAPMPLGFGWHPYFRLPPPSGGTRQTTVIRVPARRQWQLDGALLPTGVVIDLSSEHDFHAPRPLGDTYLDDVYTDVEMRNGASACGMSDASNVTTLTVAAGPSFREWVVYAPPTRPTICFEPYTCPPDAFNLAKNGIDAGVIVLQPGETWREWIELRLAVSL